MKKKVDKRHFNPGRPRLFKEALTQVKIHLTPSQIRKLTKQAKKKGTTLGAYLRELILR